MQFTIEVNVPEILEVATALRELRDESRKWRLKLFPIPVPGPITIKHILERRVDDMDLHTFEALFPPVPTGTDIVEQRFTVTVDGVAQPTVSLGTDILAQQFEVPENASVTLSLVHVDNGVPPNLSVASEKTFVATDQSPPQQPGEIDVTHISERTV